MADQSHIDSMLNSIELATTELENVKEALGVVEYHSSEKAGLEIAIDFDDSDLTELQAQLQQAEAQIQTALSVIDEIL